MTDITDFTKHQHIIEDHPEDSTLSMNVINKLSRLARIKLSEEEKKIFIKDLASVITWVDKLKDLKEEDNLETVDYQVINQKTDESPGYQHDDVLRHAETQYQCFIVPKIVEND